MSFESEMQEALNTFIQESIELSTGMEHALLELEQGNNIKDNIACIFRAAHTIKGSSGLFNLNHIVQFTDKTVGRAACFFCKREPDRSTRIQVVHISTLRVQKPIHIKTNLTVIPNRGQMMPSRT